MKRIIICCVIVAMIVTGGILSLVKITNTADDIKNSVSGVKAACLDNDFEKARILAEELSEKWDDFRRLHLLVADNEHALEITMCIARIKSLSIAENNDAITECDVAGKLIEAYGQEQIPDLFNIL